MYINTEICSFLIFVICLYFGLKSYKKLDGTNRSKAENSATLFGLAFIFLVIFLLEIFDVIKID